MAMAIEGATEKNTTGKRRASAPARKKNVQKVRTHLILILDAVFFFYPRFFAHTLARAFQQGDFDVFVRFSGRGSSKAFH